jgi:hypothetical protein
MAAEIKIARYELYPADEPICYCVGFAVTVNGRSFYRDTQVPLDQVTGKSEEEIVTLAYDQLQGDITMQIAALEAKPPILGKIWEPI